MASSTASSPVSGCASSGSPGAVGDAVELGEVLLIGGDGDARVGTPLVAGARALGKIVSQGRARPR